MTFKTLRGTKAGFRKQDGYKCMTPPEYLKILSRPQELLPGEWSDGRNNIDWDEYYPWVRERIQTWTIVQMAASLGCSDKSLGEAIIRWQREGKIPDVQWPTQKGKWTPEMTEKAAAMLSDGVGLQQIGQELGVHSTTVSYHLHQVGVSIPGQQNKLWRPEYSEIVLE